MRVAFGSCCAKKVAGESQGEIDAISGSTSNTGVYNAVRFGTALGVSCFRLPVTGLSYVFYWHAIILTVDNLPYTDSMRTC
jgi:hypothetical protein